LQIDLENFQETHGKIQKLMPTIRGRIGSDSQGYGPGSSHSPIRGHSYPFAVKTKPVYFAAPLRLVQPQSRPPATIPASFPPVLSMTVDAPLLCGWIV